MWLASIGRVDGEPVVDEDEAKQAVRSLVGGQLLLVEESGIPGLWYVASSTGWRVAPDGLSATDGVYELIIELP
jgi:hypothetical protein